MFCKGVFCEGVFRKGVFCKSHRAGNAMTLHAGCFRERAAMVTPY